MALSKSEIDPKNQVEISMGSADSSQLGPIADPSITH